MLAVVLAVSLTLWYVVVWMFRDSGGTTRRLGPASGVAPWHAIDTLPSRRS
jgi:hypothetical protein